MPYYAVGFGKWHEYGYRKATESEVAKWREDNPGKEPKGDLMVKCAHYTGSNAKTAGPFKSAKTAWHAALRLHKGASMGCSFPYVFKAGAGLSLRKLAKSIDYDRVVIQKEYVTRQNVNVIKFAKDYDKSIYPNEWRREGYCPTTLGGRRKFIKKKYGSYPPSYL